MAFEKTVPEWNAAGTEPPSSLKASGFSAGYKPPADYFNWFWHAVSQCLKELQEMTPEDIGVTPANIGALAVDGSNHMTTDLHINKPDYTQIFMRETNTNGHARLQLNGGGLMIDSAPNADDMNNRRYIMLYSDPNTPLAASVRLVDMVNGDKFWHTLYGTHNKPTKKVSITFSTSWTASGSNYTQTVTVSGGEANSLVALQPTAAQIVTLQNAGVTALVVDNNNGTFTATAVGAKPTAAMTIQATLTEVG